MENIQPTAEELALEQAAIQEVKEDEVRANIITEYGFDEVDDAERIDKLVAKEVETNKKLSQAIGQKIKHRTEADELRKKVVPPTEKKETFTPEDLEKKLDEKLNERLEKRDLDSLEYPDELKTEIQRVAKITGVSVKQALKDPYLQSKIDAYEETKEKDDKLDKATISQKHKSGTSKKFDIDNPPDVDMSTPEGIKKWDEWKAEGKKQGF